MALKAMGRRRGRTLGRMSGEAIMWFQSRLVRLLIWLFFLEHAIEDCRTALFRFCTSDQTKRTCYVRRGALDAPIG